MNFSLYIANRYLFSKSSNNAINIIAFIAVTGVIIGSLALFIVLSGFSGLKTFSLSFLNATDPDLKITASKGKSFIFTDSVASSIKNTEGIAHYSKIVEERAFFSYRKKQQVAYLKGIDKNFTSITSIDSSLVVGQWLDPNLKNQVVIGNGISNQLSLGILNYGDPLKIYTPRPGKGYTTNLKAAFNKINTQVIGVFAISEELDNKYVFTSLDAAQKLLRYKPDQITAIDIKISPDVDRENLISQLQQQLGIHYTIQTREQLNAVFYKMLNTENLVSYLIFTLILIIALFNVIGAIIMMILDKKDNLKTLFNLGATVKEIKKIFVLQGFLLSLFGMFIGLFIGMILVFLQQQFRLFMITETLAYPVEFKLFNVFVVFATITTLGFIASKIASSRISKSLIEQV